MDFEQMKEKIFELLANVGLPEISIGSVGVILVFILLFIFLTDS